MSQAQLADFEALLDSMGASFIDSGGIKRVSWGDKSKEYHGPDAWLQCYKWLYQQCNKQKAQKQATHCGLKVCTASFGPRCC